jgi:2-polyprenyl-3-methyl-5-hydroxy-6-metoxy-1,4-benzoquinol methylase
VSLIFFREENKFLKQERKREVFLYWREIAMEPMSAVEYDRAWATEWDDMKRYGPFSRYVRRILKSIIRPLEFRSVLDVGCGQGSLLEELRAEFPHIKPHGIDISQSAIELARQKVPNGRFWVLDIAKESLDEKIDLVVCSEVLEHIPDDSLALRRLARMTGKYLVISTPQGRMRQFEKTVGHVRNYAPGELVQKLEQNGFVIVSVLEWGFPFYSPLYRDVLELTGGKGTTGEFGIVRKLLSNFIYYLFMLNSSTRGDEIFVVARPADQ